MAFAADSAGGSHAGLSGLTPARREQALARWQVLRAHLEDGCPLVRVAGEHGVPERTLRRWLAAYRAGGLAALARRPRSDRGTRRMPPELQLLIEGLALRRPPPAIATVHRQAAEVARAQGWAVPGYAAVYDVVRSIDPAMATLAHEGSKRYKEVFDLVHRREAAKPNQIWQADHTLLDLWVLTPSGRPGRPWLTVIEDDHSRAVAGYAVNLGAPSALTTALAFRQAIWRKPWPGWHVCGIPDAFHVDHGSDFTSAHLEQVMADLRTRAYFSLPGQPRGRGKVERIFGTINQMCLPPLPGYAPRGTPDRAGQARLTLAELDAGDRDLHPGGLQPHPARRDRDAAAAALGGRRVHPADARLARAARPAAAHRGQAAQDPPGRHPLPGTALPGPGAGRLRRRQRDHPLRPAGHGRDPRLHRRRVLVPGHLPRARRDHRQPQGHHRRPQRAQARPGPRPAGTGQRRGPAARRPPGTAAARRLRDTGDRLGPSSRLKLYRAE